MKGDNQITVYDSMIIERQMNGIKDIIDEYGNFFYTKYPKQSLIDMISEIREELIWIENYID
ncbi:MAG: hypothetical protein R3243_16465 [Arenibacter latericius]|nr:hypothetical protein [Arenibacter latericius]